jgi:hypothetical protein
LRRYYAARTSQRDVPTISPALGAVEALTGTLFLPTLDSMKLRRLASTGIAFLLTTIVLSAQPFGLSNRVGNITLRMPPRPPATSNMTVEAFPGLTGIQGPIGFATPPGETNRLFVLERAGRSSSSPTGHTDAHGVRMSISGR